MAINGHLIMRNGPTIGCVLEIHVHFCTTIGVWLCAFPAKLVTHNRCVVAINGHLIMRNGPTIAVCWKYMSISGQISHLR